jgi:hypothetical protein
MLIWLQYTDGSAVELGSAAAWAVLAVIALIGLLVTAYDLGRVGEIGIAQRAFAATDALREKYDGLKEAHDRALAEIEILGPRLWELSVAERRVPIPKPPRRAKASRRGGKR